MSRINNGGNGNVLGSDQRLFAATTAGGSTEKNILPSKIFYLNKWEIFHLKTV